ncbi:MAG: hypothetical protein ACJ8AT_31650 [Hyalangium sp.]|uniref:hypothetical protein n=1 Tax=Hyalangium sp. TaxID=2028555 RepID=UPI00389AC7A2
MVICPMCLQSTVGEQGEEITCTHCATRFVPGQPVALKARHPPQKKTSRPRASPALILCALVPFVAPVAALVAGLAADNLSPNSFGMAFFPVAVMTFLGCWLLGGLAVVKAKRIGSRWSTVAAVGIGFSLIETPLFCYLVFTAAMHGMPRG